MYRVKILPRAKQDILEAAHWYNEKQNGLGKAFTLKVRSKVDFIVQNPLAHSVRYDEMHCAVLETFPFMIHYLIDKKAKTIIITAVFHTSMNPAKWKSLKSESMQKPALYWIKKLKLLPHPEGGFYAETFRAAEEVDGGWGKRSALTSIFYLLEGDDFSGFHRIKSPELWYWHAGETLLINEIDETGNLQTHHLSEENPFAAIAPKSWFASEVADKKSYVLVSCAVAPGFDFADFEMAQLKKITSQFPQHNQLLSRLCRA